MSDRTSEVLGPCLYSGHFGLGGLVRSSRNVRDCLEMTGIFNIQLANSVLKEEHIVAEVGDETSVGDSRDTTWMGNKQGLSGSL